MNPEDKRYKELLSSIFNNDDEKLNFLLKQKGVYGVRDELQNSLGRFVKENHSLPDGRLNEIFDSKIQMPELITSDIPGSAARYKFNPKDLSNDKILLSPGLTEAERSAAILHELGHKSDLMKGYNLSEAAKAGIASSKGLNGLEAAEKYFEGHHMDKPLFGLESLRELMKGGKLKSAGMIGPVLKALTAGAVGLGATNKAMAGDNLGAVLDAASIVDPTGIAGAASDIKNRLSDKNYAEEAKKQDYLNALPIGIADEEQAIQDNNKYSGIIKKIKGM
jgi:hypothetical protein